MTRGIFENVRMLRPGAIRPGALRPALPEDEDEHKFLTPLKVSIVAIVLLGVVGVLTSAYISGDRPSTDAPALNAPSVLQQIQNLPEDQQLELSPDDVAQLRRGGWVIPDLSSLGFSIKYTSAGLLDGVPTVRRILSYGQYMVAVYEQHRVDTDEPGDPINPMTGLGVQEQGFVKDAKNSIPGHELWILEGPPWTAVLTSKDVTFTYTSTLPISWVPSLSGQLAMGNGAKIQQDDYDGADSVIGRIERGLDRIFAGAF